MHRNLAMVVAPLLALGGCSAIAGIGDLPYPEHGLGQDASSDDSAAASDKDGPSGGTMPDGAQPDGRGPVADATRDQTGSDGGAEATEGAAVDASESGRLDTGPDAPGNDRFVQANAVSSNGAGTPTLTVAVPLPAPLAAHDSLIVAADFSVATAPQISDSLGDAFTLGIAPLTGDNGFWIAMWYVLDAKGGSESVTLTLASGGPADFLEVYVHEYTGLTGLDGTAGASGTTTAMDSGPIVTTSAGDLLFGYTAATGVGLPGSGFTPRSTLHGNLSEDEILGPAGTYDATATMMGGTRWNLLAAAFKTH
jgi:hypothetical protein